MPAICGHAIVCLSQAWPMHSAPAMTQQQANSNSAFGTHKQLAGRSKPSIGQLYRCQISRPAHAALASRGRPTYIGGSLEESPAGRTHRLSLSGETGAMSRTQSSPLLGISNAMNRRTQPSAQMGRGVADEYVVEVCNPQQPEIKHCGPPQLSRD